MSESILLVCRDAQGAEINRQTVADMETAQRLMMARNRPPLGSPLSRDYPTWAVETTIPERETWKAHGCTVYTVDDFRDGMNHGGKFVGQFFQESDMDLPTDTQIARAQLASCAPELLAALEEAESTLAKYADYADAMKEYCGRGCDPMSKGGYRIQSLYAMIANAILKAKGNLP